VELQVQEFQRQLKWLKSTKAGFEGLKGQSGGVVGRGEDLLDRQMDLADRLDGVITRMAAR
jgi:hypothetical protein